MDSSISLATVFDRELYTPRFFQNFLPIPASNDWPIGTMPPEFELPDLTRDRPIRLSEYRGNQPVILAFTRIFTTKTICPYCSPHIGALNAYYPDFLKAGIELLMITSLPVAETKAFVQKWQLDLPLLSDPTCEVFRRYQTGQALGAPLPAQFAIDTIGQLRYKHLFSFLDHNAQPQKLLKVLDGYPPTA